MGYVSRVGYNKDGEKITGAENSLAVGLNNLVVTE